MSQSMVPAVGVQPPEFQQPDPTKTATAPSLQPVLLQQAQAVEQRWYARVPAHVSAQDIMRSDFWKHVARRVKLDALITCRSDAGLFDIDLRVVQHTGDMIGVQAIRVAIFEKKIVNPIPEDAFEVKHIPNKGHGVRNKATGTWLVEGLPSGDVARQWLKDHLAAQTKN